MNYIDNSQLRPLDFQNLYDVTDGNQEFMADLLQVISKSLYSYPNDMQMALEASETAKLKSLSHKFKSSTAYLGFEELQSLLTDIELTEEINSDIEMKMQEVNKLSAHALESVMDKLYELLA